MDFVTSHRVRADSPPPAHHPHPPADRAPCSARLIGFERGSQSGTAGLRTHILVRARRGAVHHAGVRDLPGGGGGRQPELRPDPRHRGGHRRHRLPRRRRDLPAAGERAGPHHGGGHVACRRAVGVCAALGYYRHRARAWRCSRCSVLAAMRAFSHLGGERRERQDRRRNGAGQDR